jgi:D-aminopeptidase
VKEDANGGALGMSPERAHAAIRQGVERAVRNRASFKPYKLAGPYAMVLKVKEDRALYNGATRTTPLTTTFSNPSLLDILSAFNAMK